MIATLIRLALSQRWLVLMLAGGLVALGVWAFQHQQIDAYPDISGQMVQIITTYPGRAPEEVERQVTIRPLPPHSQPSFPPVRRNGRASHGHRS